MSKASRRGELVAELERLADDLDRTPTVNDVRDEANTSYQPYYTEFDSFDDALAEAGLEREPRQQGPSKDELLENVRRLAAELEKTPTLSELEDDGTFTRTPYYNKFDSWNDALERAGLEPNHEYVSDDELLQSLRDAADELGRDPLLEEISEVTDHAGTTYTRRFGSWLEAREEAGLSGDEFNVDTVHDTDSLLDELKRLGELFGRAPTQMEIVTFGTVPHTAYYNYFEDLPTALKRAGFELDETSREWPDDYPADWLDRAAKVRERDGYECTAPDCEMTNAEHKSEYGEKLHVHHVATDEGDPNALENLVTLCKSCHSKWDRVKNNPRDC